jgi:radical SAM protein with 4Fe4S-binding SPASM domain
MCDIWKIRTVREITRRDLEPHAQSLRSLQVRWVVLSGGEALMHHDLWPLAQLCREVGARLTLLSSGLLLEKHAAHIAQHIDDVIVSLDGPPDVHDRVRGIPGAYRITANGVAALRAACSDISIAARCTAQPMNFRRLRDTVSTARELTLNSISFLAADMSPGAFNHSNRASELQRLLGLSSTEVDGLEEEIEALIHSHAGDIASKFILEDPEKLRRLGRHFRACLGESEAVSPRCNAPWVSAVIEADGSVRPCFFHHPIGNIADGSLDEVLNGDRALAFRGGLDVAANPVCRGCVCSLFWREGSMKKPI